MSDFLKALRAIGIALVLFFVGIMFFIVLTREPSPETSKDATPTPPRDTVRQVMPSQPEPEKVVPKEPEPPEPTCKQLLEIERRIAELSQKILRSKDTGELNSHRQAMDRIVDNVPPGKPEVTDSLYAAAGSWSTLAFMGVGGATAIALQTQREMADEDMEKARRLLRQACR